MSYRLIVLLSAIAAAALIGWMVERSPRAPIELKAEDILMRMAPTAASGDIAMVALDDSSVQRYGAVKKWPRSVLAAGLRRIEAQNPRLVVLDLALDGRTHTGDADLWRTIADNRNVVLAMAYDGDRTPEWSPDDIRSLRFLERYAIVDNFQLNNATSYFRWANFEPPVSDFTGSASGVGVYDRETDPDGIVRTSRMLYASTVVYPPADRPLPPKFPITKYADGLPVALPDLSLISSMRAYSLDKQDFTVSHGEDLLFAAGLARPVDIPVDQQERMNIRFGGPAGRYPTVSFADLIDGKTQPDALKGKVVLVGTTATGDPESEPRLTPFGWMTRTEVTANALQTVFDRSYFWRPAAWAIGISLIFGLISGLILMASSGARQGLMAVALIVLYLLVAYVCYAHASIMLPIIPGLLIVVVPYLVALALYLGPYRPIVLESSPTYVPPGRPAVGPA